MLTIVNVRREQIVKNEKNEYSISGIPSLAESIKQYGLVQPLHVADIGNEKYKLLGGERRLSAIDMLIADDSVPDWTSETLIPCVIKGIDDVAGGNVWRVTHYCEIDFCIVRQIV